MCDLENGKCCGACTHPETEEKPELVHCDFCDKDDDTQYVTKDWENTGWAVCEDCRENKDKVIGILLGALHNRTDSEYTLRQEYRKMKEAALLRFKTINEQIESASGRVDDFCIPYLKGYLNSCIEVFEKTF